MKAAFALLVLANIAHADPKGVVFEGTALPYARATLYQTPYGNVTLDLDLSEKPMRCDQGPVGNMDIDHGRALALSVHPGPANTFFAGAAAFDVQVFLYLPREDRAADVTLPRGTLRLAPFKPKGKAAMAGELTLAGSGGGRFTTTLCPIKKVTLPVPPPEAGPGLAAVVDGKPWKPAKVIALRALVDKKPTVMSLYVVDANHTCETPTGPGSIGLDVDAALLHPGTVQPTRATITPPNGDATYAAITSLAWLRVDITKDAVKGTFAARQDAAKGARWEASGTFTAELCPVK